MSKFSHDKGPFEDIDVDEIVGNRTLITVAKSWQLGAAERIVENSRRLDASKREATRTQRELAEARVERERAIGKMTAKVAKLEEQVRSSEGRIGEMRRTSMAAVGTAWLGALLLSLGTNLLTQDPSSYLAVLILLLGAAAEVSAWFVRSPGKRRQPHFPAKGPGEPTP